MFTEKSFIDSINVLQDGQIEVRRVDLVLKESVEVGKTYHRHCLCPGDDVFNEDSKVSAVAQAVWTPEVIAAWEAQAQNPFEG